MFIFVGGGLYKKTFLIRKLSKTSFDSSSKNFYKNFFRSLLGNSCRSFTCKLFMDIYKELLLDYNQKWLFNFFRSYFENSPGVHRVCFSEVFTEDPPFAVPLKILQKFHLHLLKKSPKIRAKFSIENFSRKLFSKSPRNSSGNSSEISFRNSLSSWFDSLLNSFYGGSTTSS